MQLLFIMGTGRCGSTLVHELLCQHERVGFVSNIEDSLPLVNRLGRWNNAIFRTTRGRFTGKKKLRYAPSEAYRIMGREVSPIYVESCRDLTARDVTPWLARRFRDFFELRARAQGCDFFVHKYTGWPRAAFFAEIFPEARFLQIVRDGRAVASSWLQTPWWGGYRGPERWQWGPLEAELQDEWERSGRSFARLAAIGWKRLVTAGRDSQESLGAQRLLTVRFEDLIARPGEHFDAILEFSGLGGSAGLERALRQHHFHNDRVDAYRRELTPAQVEEIEESARAELDLLGYR